MEHMRAANAVVQDVVQVAHNRCFQSGTRSVLVGVLGGTHNEVRVEPARNRHKEGDAVPLVLQLRHYRGDDLRDPNSDGLDVRNTRTDTAQVRVTAVQGHLVSNVGVDDCHGAVLSTVVFRVEDFVVDGVMENKETKTSKDTTDQKFTGQNFPKSVYVLWEAKTQENTTHGAWESPGLVTKGPG